MCRPQEMRFAAELACIAGHIIASGNIFPGLRSQRPDLRAPVCHSEARSNLSSSRRVGKRKSGMRKEHIRVIRLRCVEFVLVKPNLVGGGSRSTIDVLGSNTENVDGDTGLIARRIVSDIRHAHVIPGVWGRGVAEANARLAWPDVFNV